MGIPSVWENKILEKNGIDYMEIKMNNKPKNWRDKVEEILAEYATSGAFKAGGFRNTAKQLTSLTNKQIKKAKQEDGTDLLQRQRGVMGMYNCKLGRNCVFVKKYFELVEKEIDKLKPKSKT